MRTLLPLLLALGTVGCASEPEAPKADVPGKAPTYQMVPATTGGGSAAPSAGGAPTPPSGTTGNPASPGSD